MTFQKYTSYKESGVEWLGVIPQDWEVRRLASLGRFSKGGGISRDKLVDSGVSAILYGDIYTKYNYSTIETKNFISLETTKSAIKIIENDLLLTGSGETKEDIGKCIVFKGLEAFAGGDIIIFKQNKSNSTFLSYSLSSSYSVMQKMIMAKGEIIVHIYGSALKELLLPIPPKDEQTKIASYLDEKTAQIDEVISQKEKLIELLKERKQIVINEAITKGLDKTAEFKESGVEWIGKIPKHWEVIKFKHLFYEKKKTHNINLKCGSISFGKVVEKNDEKIPASTKASYQVLNKNEFLINPLNLNYDLKSLRIGLSGLDVVVSSGYIIVNNKKDMDKNYFNWLLHRYDISFMKTLGAGVRQTLNYNDIGETLLVNPPIEEQSKIAKHIEIQTTKIDNAIEHKQNYITKLKEYKATLIDSVVTGKVRIA